MSKSGRALGTTNLVSHSFEKNLPKYRKLTSFIRWYPDLFLDIIKPDVGGIRLDPDQRIFLRVAVRSLHMHGCFTRGYGKTYDEVLANFISCVAYPQITISVTAQTKENACKILKEKVEEILTHFPLLKNEIEKSVFNKNEAIVTFRNGAVLDALANSQSSKGSRRRRLSAEESFLINAETFEDALQPIPEIVRSTCGPLSVVSPYEPHHQIHFFTTPGWKSSSEFERNVTMVKAMRELSGDIVLGSDWKLPCWFGRGSTKSEILRKKKKMSPIAFAQNYGGEWTGATSGAVVSMFKLMECRTISKPVTEAKHKNDEYYLAMDVARSQTSDNNQSSIFVGKVQRGTKTNKITRVEIVNIINIPNILNFTAQAAEVKKIRQDYDAKVVVVDGNGLGSGLVDALLQETVDPLSGTTLECWDTINTNNMPEVAGSPKYVFDIKSQAIQSQIVTTFIDYVNSGKVRFLEKVQEQDLYRGDKDLEREIMPFVQTDLFFEEVSNLRLKHNSNGSINVEQVVKRINKDRFSACSYLLYYINEYENIGQIKEPVDMSAIVRMARRPSYLTSERW